MTATTHGSKMVVVTGGEPALQWSQELATAIGAAGFRTHMETNGTTVLAAKVDWLTISPKPRFHPKHIALVASSALGPDECKVVVDATVDRDVLAGFERRYSCDHWFLQPCDDESYERNLARSIALVSERPQWQLSLQYTRSSASPKEARMERDPRRDPASSVRSAAHPGCPRGTYKSTLRCGAPFSLPRLRFTPMRASLDPGRFSFWP